MGVADNNDVQTITPEDAGKQTNQAIGIAPPVHTMPGTAAHDRDLRERCLEQAIRRIAGSVGANEIALAKEYYNWITQTK